VADAGGAIRPCIIVPVYDHEGALPATVEQLRRFQLTCYLVDDGSHAACARVIDDLGAREAAWVRVLRLPSNGGKGAAVMRGIAAAHADGYTHAVQVDADGQHDLDDLPRLLEISRTEPRALVTGIPVYDDKVPRSRLYGRYVTHVWVWIETLSLEIRDSMCGFRVYPVAATHETCGHAAMSRRMGFDSEVMVRLWWRGVPLRQLPTRVTYPLDGVSHFDVLWDNVRLIGVHTRLACGMLLRLPWLLARLVKRHLGWRKDR
jgi:glycosyltransferase involved in cell wall biosynthesis